MTATAAHATHTGDPGQVTYNIGNTTYVANQDGSGATVLASDSQPGGNWSPDGSRYAFASSGGIKSVRRNGGTPVTVTTNASDRDPYWSGAGQRVYFSRNGQLLFASSDGSRWEVPLGENPSGAYQDVNPTVSDFNDIIFERKASGASGIYQYNYDDPSNPKPLVSNASAPDFAPDGDRFAYVSNGQVWLADAADGGNKVQLTTDASGATDPAFSPDGSSVLYTTTSGTVTVKRITIDTKQVATVKQGGTTSAWQPIVYNSVERVWGADGTDTAIATSQWNYADRGNSGDPRPQAGAVVLSRSDTYLDALVGSALAINKQAPLLITAPTNSVETRVLAEIKRVLGTSGDIYLLGGTLALPAGIETQLKNLGYSVHRIWGANHYATAIAINKQITSDPQTAIITTGANYYDALAAGAAAGANPGTVIVLTDGYNMPAESASYLNGINPDYANGGTAIVTAGGPGDAALENALNSGKLSWSSFYYWPLVGANEKDTAVALAEFFFAAPTVAAVSTNKGWQDALTGGAMIGAAFGPLLLTDPNALYGPVQTYLSENSGGMWDVVMLGGYLALPDALINPLGNAISAPGAFDYYPGGATISAGGGKNTLRAQTADPKAELPGADGKANIVPGTKLKPKSVQ